ncbi:MAG: hypothetical protein M1548_00650 [Actinobacteria bacterium]|nr:hypothetical protein [Actinomycetota bacterium]
MPDIKKFLGTLLKTTDKRVRIIAGVIALFAIALAAYRSFPGEGTITGRVKWRDPVGYYPVVGARVLVVRGDKIIIEKQTDDQGRFNLAVQDGGAELIVADLNSVKTGGASDYTITKRVWLARFWKKRLSIGRGGSVSFDFNNDNLDRPEIKYFSTGQLMDYRNRTGWSSGGPFSEADVSKALTVR